MQSPLRSPHTVPRAEVPRRQNLTFKENTMSLRKRSGAAGNATTVTAGPAVSVGAGTAAAVPSSCR